MSEQLKPDYYQLEIKGVKCDFFDIIKALDLPFTLGSAFKYFRKKGDVEKQINDLEKSIVCIQREIEYLKLELNKPV